MTRETKIGLLVGLAFIIVIGILLSDYNRLETSPAPLYGTRADVLQSTAAPGTADNQVTTAVVPPPPSHVSPRQIVPLKEEVNGSHPANSSQVIEVRPGTGNPVPAITNRLQGPQNTSDDSNEQVVVGPPPGTNSDATSSGSNDTGNVPDSLSEAARRNQEEIVSLPSRDGHTTGSPNGTSSKPTSTANAHDAATATEGRKYTAQPGDTLSKLAGRFMGGNTKANRDALVKANPSLQKNINNVVVGRVYLIPTGGATPPSPAAAPTNEKKTQPRPAVASADKPLSSTPQYWYTVKENDSLWKIAQEQLGDGNAWAAIKELNKDLLKGKAEVRPKMRLRLPAKPVASAN